jgi:hypothetical protein
MRGSGAVIAAVWESKKKEYMLLRFLFFFFQPNSVIHPAADFQAAYCQKMLRILCPSSASFVVPRRRRNQ